MSNTIVFVSLHVRPSAQAVALPAATLAASLPCSLYPRTRLFDVFPDDDDDVVVERILKSEPALVSFSLYVWNRQRVLRLAAILRQRCPGLPLVVGGPEATANVESLESLGVFDRVCAGEGELIISELVAAVDQHQDLATVSGEQLGPVDMENQVSPWLSQQLQPGSGVLWEVSRGCPFSCSFCYDARGEHGVRAVPTERLEQELKLFVQHGVSQVWVLDSTFNFPVERGRKLLQLISELAPHIHFHLEAKAEFIDEATVELLQNISCSVQVGLQSARPEVLRNIQRPLDCQLFQQKVGLLSEAGITFGIDLMYGLPGDDFEGLGKSLDFVLNLRPNHVEIFPLALLPGTKLHQQRHDFGLQAEQEPPYSLICSNSMDASQLGECRRLAAVTDLIYNTGRAMAYFLELCYACDIGPLAMIEQFSSWLLSDQLSLEQLYQSEWSAAQSRDLQFKFVDHYLHQTGRDNLLPAINDQILFHSVWADTLLGEEILPSNSLAESESWSDICWQLSPAVTIANFNYDVQDYYLASEIDLVERAEFYTIENSVGLFARRGEEVICVSIDSVLAALLRCCDGRLTMRQIVAGQQLTVDEAMLQELLGFAVTEGVLIAV